METLARMSPADYALIIGGTAAFLFLRSLWDWRLNIVDYVARMRRSVTPATATAPVAATATEARNVIAMPRNDSNDDLPRNDRNAELRRLQADIIARLLKAGVYVPDGKGGYKELKQTALITLATGIVSNGRAESDYGQLRAELEKLINPRLVVAAGRPEEREISQV